MFVIQADRTCALLWHEAYDELRAEECFGAATSKDATDAFE
jgi:hypothetical protein